MKCRGWLLFLGLFSIFGMLALLRIDFGYDGGRLLGAIGTVLALVPCWLISRNVLGTSLFSRLQKVSVFVALPFAIHVLGVIITNNNGGIGSN
ncbi:MAG: hypothetical protein IPM93_28990 [Candidatus Obscuribacter sp.]|nr:hypothetical protein [Candidatus Obscuribacter sp.]